MNNSLTEPNGTQAQCINGTPHLNGHSNGHSTTNATSPHLPTLSTFDNPETALLGIMALHPGTIAPVCLQRDALNRNDFHDPVAGCIFAAFATAAREQQAGMPETADVLAQLRGWSDDTLLDHEKRALAIEAAALFPSVSECAPGDLTQAVARETALDLAKRIKSEGVPDEAEPAPKQKAPKPPREVEEVASGEFAQNDIGNGNRFAHEHRAKLRWCEVWGKYAHHKEGRWQPDEHGVASQAAKKTSLAVASQAANETDDDKRARMLKHAASLTRRAARDTMLKDAASVPGMSITPEQFDTDLDLFNVANGTLHLPTRTLRPHNPDDLLTHQSPVRFDSNAQCPIWRACMERWIPDEETRRYLQKLVGVSLSGRVFEELFVFLYGDGDNGKSTFLREVERICGTYWHKTQAETIMQARDKRKSEAPSPDLLALKGARLVTVHEIESTHTLNAALIKDLTGRDAITARGLFEKRPTTFEPQYLLWMFGNGKPKIEDQSGGMWRRPRLIPFGQPIPANERDPLLSGKLDDELSGILNWALDGLRDASETGLKAPEAVQKAVNEYRAEQDALADFLRSCCIVGENHTAAAGELWRAWETWSRETGEKTGTQRAFGTELTRRKFENYRGNTGNRWRGIGLLSNQTPPHQPHQPHQNPEKVVQDFSRVEALSEMAAVGAVGAVPTANETDEGDPGTVVATAWRKFRAGKISDRQRDALLRYAAATDENEVR